MASAVIGALRVNLGIDTAQFNEGLRGLRGSLDRVGKSMQGWGTKLTTYVSAPITAAGTAIGLAVSGIAKDAQELQKLAQVSNAGFEEFQRLAHGAKTVGVESEKLADIYKDINDRVGDFVQTGGGPMADFFENIAPKVGITADAFKELSGPQALQLYYDSLVKAGVSQQDMVFYLEAMASDVTALIPLLKDGGKGFADLGKEAAVLSDADAAGLQKWNDATRQFGEAIRALTIAIATSGLLEWMTQAAQTITQWVQYLAQTNPEILKWGSVVAGLAAIVGPLVVTLSLFVSAVAAISAPVLAVVAAITAATAAVIAFWPEIKAAWEWVTKLFDVFVRLHAEALSAVIAKFQELGTTLRDSVATIIRDIIQAFVDLHVRMFEIGGQIIDGLWQGIKAKWESVKGGIANIGTSISDSVKSALGIHSPSRVMHEVGVNIMQGLNNGMQSVDVKGTATSAASEIENAFQGIGNSIGQALAGTKKWSEVLKEVLQTLLNKAFSSFGTGSGSGGSGGIGGFISSILGGVFGFASGGTILPGGAGGIDSQLVAFRKSPNERVDITKPGQTLGSSREDVGVRVFVDRDGNWQAAVESIADTRAKAITRSGIAQYDRTMPARMQEHQNRYG